MPPFYMATQNSSLRETMRESAEGKKGTKEVSKEPGTKIVLRFFGWKIGNLELRFEMGKIGFSQIAICLFWVIFVHKLILSKL